MRRTNLVPHEVRGYRGRSAPNRTEAICDQEQGRPGAGETRRDRRRVLRPARGRRGPPRRRLGSVRAAQGLLVRRQEAAAVHPGDVPVHPRRPDHEGGRRRRRAADPGGVPVRQRHLDLLGTGWLGAYFVLSGSPAAATAISLFGAGTLTKLQTFTMLSGSRLGASFIVLLTGFIYSLRNRNDSNRTEPIGMEIMGAYDDGARVHLPGALTQTARPPRRCEPPRVRGLGGDPHPDLGARGRPLRVQRPNRCCSWVGPQHPASLKLLDSVLPQVSSDSPAVKWRPG